ncbi:hypothetical protein Abr02nite_04590 [Paractinoplanes brasiliensis]|nr:hypothetical protein Abr02nite_04590 [Actinoplanes brasiliensis]
MRVATSNDRPGAVPEGTGVGAVPPGAGPGGMLAAGGRLGGMLAAGSRLGVLLAAGDATGSEVQAERARTARARATVRGCTRPIVRRRHQDGIGAHTERGPRLIDDPHCHDGVKSPEG